MDDRGPDLKRGRRAPRALASLLLAALILLASAAAAQATTVNVTRTDDPSGAGDCLATDTSCSLRQAVNAENGTPSGGDTIELGASTYALTQGTDIIATKPFVLQGTGVTSTTIDGSQNSGTNPFAALARILRVDTTAAVTIQDLTFTGGIDEEDENCSNGCSTINANGGGALFNNGGTVTLDGVAFTNNFGSGTPLGGAVSNGSGTLTMNDVSFTNDGAGVGGGLFTRSGTVTGNGITFENDGTTCCDGGAAYLLGGTVTLTNSTIVNSGGFDDRRRDRQRRRGAEARQRHAVGQRRGPSNRQGGASTIVENTILGTGQPGDTACVAPGQTATRLTARRRPRDHERRGENIAQDTSCALAGDGDISNVDPKLAPISDNTGPTRTEALLAGSPALGDPSTNDCPDNDQRGVSRGDGNCDIGAFEAVLHGVPTTATTGAAQNVTDTTADLTGTINLAGEAGGFHFEYGTTSPSASSARKLRRGSSQRTRRWPRPSPT